MTTDAIRNELTRLEAATPSTIAAFAESRAARIAELKHLLTLPRDEPAPHDKRLETALRNSGGGDQFDRRR